MIRKMCHWPGCTRAAEGNYCAAHKAQAEEKKKGTRLFEGTRRGGSAPYHSLYSCARWKKLRREHLAERPLCAMCGSPATDVDHIIPHRGEEALFFNPDNLQSLCKSCHSAKTLRENGNFNRRKR